MNPKNAPVLLPFALIVVASLLAVAWIVASVDGWRVLWALYPLALGLAALSNVVERSKPELPPVTRRPEPD